MTITREHLELAALAAGHTVYGWCTGPIPLIGERGFFFGRLQGVSSAP